MYRMYCYLYDNMKEQIKYGIQNLSTYFMLIIKTVIIFPPLIHEKSDTIGILFVKSTR